MCLLFDAYDPIPHIDHALKHSDLRHLLYQTAIRHGASIYLNSEVTRIDSHRRIVELASGHSIRADVIIAADGPSGIGRRQLLESEGLTDRDATSLRWMVYK
jgi:2-polyprenyl-6-methoxyphenol hydroxylase-like FAD-dependent oxidoreductase